MTQTQQSGSTDQHHSKRMLLPHRFNVGLQGVLRAACRFQVFMSRPPASRTPDASHRGGPPGRVTEEHQYRTVSRDEGAEAFAALRRDIGDELASRPQKKPVRVVYGFNHQCRPGPDRNMCVVAVVKRNRVVEV